MKGAQIVEVIREDRLKSELAVYIWAQAQYWREHKHQSADEKGETARFGKRREDIIEGISKLAGQKLKHSDLVGQITTVIGAGDNEEFFVLHPDILASKISARPAA